VAASARMPTASQVKQQRMDWLLATQQEERAGQV
jgi:hypothetical protein